MDKVRMALIGAGTWGANHARIYKAHPFAEVVAICDMNREKAERVAREEGIEKVYTDYNQMLAEVDCDAVAIVTPDFAHVEAAVAAANAKKHILIEKPLATTREGVFTIMEAVKRNGVRAMVDLHNRWSPPFNAAWQSIRAGELGNVYSGYFRLNDCQWVATDLLPWASKSSVLWFLGSHSFDTLMWLLGSRPTRVYSVSKSGVLKALGVDTVDEYLTTIEFENGAVAQMENGWATPNGNPNTNDIKCTILGDKGMITIDTTHHNMIQKYSDTQTTVPDVLVQNHVFGQPKGFAYESIRAFIDCLLTGEEFPVSLEDAAVGVLTILAIMESSKTREPIQVELGQIKSGSSC